jgi:hypothetical protein
MKKFLTRLLLDYKFQDRFVLIVGVGWSISMVVPTLMVISHHR